MADENDDMDSDTFGNELDDVGDEDNAPQGGSSSGEGGGFFTRALDTVKAVLFGDVVGGVHTPTMINQLLVAVVAIIVILAVVNLVRAIVSRLVAYRSGTPWVVQGTKDARHEMRISQDPRVDASIPLRRSLNESDGMEFSYMLWMFIDDYEYKKGEWKHVFHKGNVEATPNRAPGVWLHPNENKMRVYMNTFQTISSFVDIGNIPVSKWFHLSIVLKQRTMDIYINGFLKKRVTFDSIPRQNFGDLWVNTRGGFAGFVSRMRYFDYAVNFTEVENALRVGPSMDLPAAATQKPPYLVPHWWSNEYGQ